MLLTSCGYHFTQKQEPLTISLPFISGDDKGFLTAQVIRAVYENPFLCYRNEGGDINLSLEIKHKTVEQIGYQRDRNKVDNTIKKNLRPVEGRQILEIKMSACKDSSSAPLFEPVCLKAEVDFDFVDGDALSDLSFINRDGRRDTVLRFSLGQLEPKDNAIEASHKALYKRIAQKIVDQLVDQLIFSKRET